VLLSTPLHACNNFTTFAKCIVQLANKRGLKKNNMNRKERIMVAR
jgi:hypothetical protein